MQIIFYGNLQLDSWKIPTVLEDELCHCISETQGVGSSSALWLLNPLVWFRTTITKITNMNSQHEQIMTTCSYDIKQQKTILEHLPPWFSSEVK